MFRGRIQPTLRRSLPPVPAILLTATIFAAAHLSPLKFPPLLVAGVIYGAAVHSSGSVWAGVILHASVNAAAALLATFNNLGLDLLGPLTLRPKLALLGAALASFTALWAIARRVQRLTSPSPFPSPSD